MKASLAKFSSNELIDNIPIASGDGTSRSRFGIAASGGELAMNTIKSAGDLGTWALRRAEFVEAQTGWKDREVYIFGAAAAASVTPRLFGEMVYKVRTSLKSKYPPTKTPLDSNKLFKIAERQQLPKTVRKELSAQPEEFVVGALEVCLIDLRNVRVELARTAKLSESA